MRIYYVNDAEGPACYVRSALGVDAEGWNRLHGRFQDWRYAMAGDYNVPTRLKLNARDLLADRGRGVRIDNTGRRLTPEQGAEIFMNGLRVIRGAAAHRGGIEVINVCLRKADVPGYERLSLDRLLDRIDASVSADDRYAHLVFDDDGEWVVEQLYGRPGSRYGVGEVAERIGDTPIERILGDPSLRGSQDDDLLQMADLIAHALLKQEEQPSEREAELSLHLAFGILKETLNHEASRTDP